MNSHSLKPIIALIFTAITIASYSATPTVPPTSRTFDYDITVPLFYNGQNVGSTVIPKGSAVEVVSETATTITIRHMGNVLTIAKPEKTPVKTTAVPTNPAAPTATRDTSHDAENDRMYKIPRRTLPYPVIRVEIETDGSYTIAGFTVTGTYSYERVGTKIRLLNTQFGLHRIWEVNDADSLEEKVKTDLKLVEAVKTYCADSTKCGYTYDKFLEKFGTADKTRVSFAPNEYAISKAIPLKGALELIATGDPRMQSLIDYADKETASSLRKEHIAPQCTRVGIREIAKELMDDKTPDEAISLRDDFEKVKVTHRAQIGNTCEIYSAYHMLDYYMKKGVIKPFSFEQFRTMTAKYGSTAGNRVGITINGLLNLLHAIQPDLKIRVREMPGMSPITQTSFQGSPQIFRAFVQHELAKSRPLLISTGDHRVVGVGLQGNPSDALIALDSTGFSKADHGYTTWNLTIMCLATSLEFTK